MIALAFRGKNQRKPKLEDFILKFDRESGRITDPKQIEMIFRAMAQRGTKAKPDADDKRQM